MEYSDSDTGSDGRLLLRQIDKQSRGGGLTHEVQKISSTQPSFESDDANVIKEPLIESWRAIRQRQITRFCVADLLK